MKYRVTRYSTWKSLMYYLTLIVIIFNVTLLVMKTTFDELIRRGIVNPVNTRTDLYAILAVVITAFFVDIIYTKIRWRIVDDPSLFCIHCDYNLMGNESGICPECGTEILS